MAWELEKAGFRGQLEYRLNFVILTFLGIAYQGSGFAFIWVVLSRFHSLDGWTFRDLAFLYSLRLLAHACWIMPFNMLSELDMILREGSFDQFLVRPLNPLLQVITCRFRMNVVGDVVTALGLFILAANLASVSFSPLHVLYLVLAVLGGALAEGAVILIVASFTFRLLETWALRFLIDNVYLMFGSYPMSIFGAATGWLFTWIVPVAFVAYIPSSALLDRTAGLSVSPIVAWGAPAVGFVWFWIAYQIWRWQLKSYQSSGH
jgi:viologen exporter family transport system permease protein